MRAPEIGEDDPLGTRGPAREERVPRAGCDPVPLRSVCLHDPDPPARAARDERDSPAVGRPGRVERGVVSDGRKELPLARPVGADDVNAGLGEPTAARKRDQAVPVGAARRVGGGCARARNDRYRYRGERWPCELHLAIVAVSAYPLTWTSLAEAGPPQDRGGPAGSSANPLRTLLTPGAFGFPAAGSASERIRGSSRSVTIGLATKEVIMKALVYHGPGERRWRRSRIRRSRSRRT